MWPIRIRTAPSMLTVCPHTGYKCLILLGRHDFTVVFTKNGMKSNFFTKNGWWDTDWGEFAYCNWRKLGTPLRKPTYSIQPTDYRQTFPWTVGRLEPWMNSILTCSYHISEWFLGHWAEHWSLNNLFDQCFAMHSKSFLPSQHNLTNLLEWNHAYHHYGKLGRVGNAQEFFAQMYNLLGEFYRWRKPECSEKTTVSKWNHSAQGKPESLETRVPKRNHGAQKKPQCLNETKLRVQGKPKCLEETRVPQRNPGAQLKPQPSGRLRYLTNLLG